METILFIFTSVFGTLKLLSFTKLFDITLAGVFSIIIPVKNKVLKYFDCLIFYAALGYQIYFFGHLLNLC